MTKAITKCVCAAMRKRTICLNIMETVYQNISNFLFVRYVGPMQRSIRSPDTPDLTQPKPRAVPLIAQERLALAAVSPSARHGVPEHLSPAIETLKISSIVARDSGACARSRGSQFAVF